ncbi:hypothetical protein HK097_011698 [Rhizophlyctis rosea]|uniref:Uncharacterized protein n=1 Tax=Rhizophlyctis rosea TaxID=64517 RepID=A0AAD5WZQ9_9FUNG|nr:hypothetical protein HK097_011698 [Rhizophlyctis rosea]
MSNQTSHTSQFPTAPNASILSPPSVAPSSPHFHNPVPPSSPPTDNTPTSNEMITDQEEDQYDLDNKSLTPEGLVEPDVPLVQRRAFDVNDLISQEEQWGGSAGGISADEWKHMHDLPREELLRSQRGTARERTDRRENPLDSPRQTDNTIRTTSSRQTHHPKPPLPLPNSQNSPQNPPPPSRPVKTCARLFGPPAPHYKIIQYMLDKNRAKEEPKADHHPTQPTAPSSATAAEGNYDPVTDLTVFGSMAEYRLSRGI